MNLLLVLSLILITLGLSLGVLGGMRRSSQDTTGQEATGKSTETAATIADGGAASGRDTDGHSKKGAKGFVYPATDGERDIEEGFVFAASGQHAAPCPGGRAGEHSATQRPETPDGRSHRDDTTEKLSPSAPAKPGSSQAINLIAEREEWITAWQQTVNTESTYHETGAEWGVEFNGTVLFVIEPDDAYATALQCTDDDISDGIAFVAELADGTVHSTTTIARAQSDQDEYGFTIHGPYSMEGPYYPEDRTARWPAERPVRGRGRYADVPPVERRNGRPRTQRWPRRDDLPRQSGVTIRYSLNGALRTSPRWGEGQMNA